DMETFTDSMDNMILTQKRVAEGFMRDGTYESLCPPLKALVSIMVEGNYEGKDRQHPDIRKMFTKEYVLNSAWYQERLKIKQDRDIKLWTKNVDYLENFLSLKNFSESAEKLDVKSRLLTAKEQLASVKSDSYMQFLKGSIGADHLKPIDA
ncbi:MAG: hypothetical protein ACFCUU_01525, partial [Cyclobacteriaceae bacterium]